MAGNICRCGTYQRIRSRHPPRRGDQGRQRLIANRKFREETPVSANP